MAEFTQEVSSVEKGQSTMENHTQPDHSSDVHSPIVPKSLAEIPRSASTREADGQSSSVATKKRNKLHKRHLIAIVALIIVIFLIIVGVYKKSQKIEYPDYEGFGHGALLVEVAPGATASELVPELLKNDVIKSEGAFITAANENPKITSMQPGFYQLRKQMSAAAAVEALLDTNARSGAVNLPDGVTLEDVQVINGDTVPGIYVRLSEASCYQLDQEKKCVKAVDFQRAVMHLPPRALGIPEWAIRNVAQAPNKVKALEGLIAPGLHIFDPRQTPAHIIKSLIEKSMKIYSDAGLKAAGKARHLTPYEVLVMASLLQREVTSDDYERVSRVIINRLRKGMPLQFDSTVNYAIVRQEVATTDLARQTDTPWNTYVNAGLPATPICSPSPQAIDALIDPEEGPWLYFVTVDKKGTTKFNSTIEGHERDVELARKNGVFDRQKKDSH